MIETPLEHSTRRRVRRLDAQVQSITPLPSETDAVFTPEQLALLFTEELPGDLAALIRSVAYEPEAENHD